MAFTTLADRFEQRSRNIYSKFPSSEAQLITIKPDTDNGAFGSTSRIKNDTRAIPVVSTLRDVTRVSRFLQSPDGRLFVGNQALLQTGNTFADTKLYNPLSSILNAVPFVHARRHVPSKILVSNPSGLLQNTTVDDVSSKFNTMAKLQTTGTSNRNLLQTVNNLAKTYAVRQLRNAANTILPLPQKYSRSRPEYIAFEKGGPRIFDPQPLNERGSPRLNVITNIKKVVSTKVTTPLVQRSTALLNRVIPKSLRNVVPPTKKIQPQEKNITFEQAAAEFKNNFYTQNGRTTSRFKSKYLNEVPTPVETSLDSSIVLATEGSTSLNDPYNIAPFQSSLTGPNTTGNVMVDKLNYGNIIKDQSPKSDIIKFVFRDAQGNNPVHFRALMSALKESVKTEFNEQRYVGRTERFVTYGGAKRGVSISFNIVAFTERELDGMWTKINYLTGLAFPKSAVNGFMVPPLFKITVGGIYDNQPCYIESLDYDFLDESITFDIDREVPFAINVTMQLSILEKRSKFHDSPFYKITEDAEQTIRTRNQGARRAQSESSSTINAISKSTGDLTRTSVGRVQRDLLLRQERININDVGRTTAIINQALGQ